MSSILDPLDDTLWNTWRTRARTNTETYRNVFRPIPDDTVESWEMYRKFSESKGPQLSGHVWPGLSMEEVREELSRIKGFVVEFPLMFLCNEKMGVGTFTKEFLLPIQVFT